MLGFGYQRKNYVESIEHGHTHFYNNKSLPGTSQGLSVSWEEAYKRKRVRPKRTINEVIQRDLLMKGLSPSMTIDQVQ